MDLETSKPDVANSEEAQRNFAKHKEHYEKLRADVAVKMQFLDENRVSGKICNDKIAHQNQIIILTLNNFFLDKSDA